MASSNTNAPTTRHPLSSEPITRPVAYDLDGPHPDQRPCPPWCWLVAGEDISPTEAHGIESRWPLMAEHVTEEPWRVALNGYRPHHGHQFATLAHLNIDLYQRGQGTPSVRVGLRDYPADADPAGEYREVMGLQLAEAAELASVLREIVDIAREARDGDARPEIP